MSCAVPLSLKRKLLDAACMLLSINRSSSRGGSVGRRTPIMEAALSGEPNSIAALYPMLFVL